MSTNKSNKSQKFKPPFKRKQIDHNFDETPQQKRDKPEVKPLVVKKDRKTDDKPLAADIQSVNAEEDNSEDTVLGMDRKTDQIKLSDKSVKSCIFVSANEREERVVTNQMIQKMSFKFGSLAETESDEHKSDAEDNQLVPEISMEQMTKDVLECDEFIDEWADEWTDDF